MDSTDAVVGRDPAVALVMQGEGSLVVSGRHARFFLADGYWWVEDVGSRNGTFVDGRKLEAGGRYRLRTGAEIALGTSGPRLRVEEADSRLYAATPAEPMPAVPMQTVAESRPLVAAPAPAPAPADPAAQAASAAPPQPAPQPTGPQHVRLILRSGDGKRLAGQDADVIIGRSHESTIRVEGDMSMAVSRRHARIFYSGWKICIEDAGSRNGTWLNRKRVQSATVIERGDVIEFGAGGPRLTVEDVALVPAEPSRRPTVDMAAPAADGFVSELPTPAPRPAARASGET